MAHKAVGEVNKLDVLTNFLSYTVWKNTDECQMYDNAVRIHDSLFLNAQMKKLFIYSRTSSNNLVKV